jgi:hypothetical protein
MLDLPQPPSPQMVIVMRSGEGLLDIVRLVVRVGERRWVGGGPRAVWFRLRFVSSEAGCGRFKSSW